ncbi:MAG: NAD-dependent epimerase/dehydratase [Magnetococcus sp. THC-1_WYH]
MTGASGFVGRHVLTQLQLHRIETIVVGRTCPIGFEGEFIEADLLQPKIAETVIRRTQPSHLMHLAWYAEHGQYWTSPLNLRWLEATVHLVEAFCAAGGKHVIVAGTCAEYDWSAGYCREDVTPLAPTTLYGIAKDATRRLIAAICDASNVPWAWGRIFLPYGPGEDNRRLIPSLIEVFKGRRTPFSVNANAYRDFLHVEDVANVFITLLKHNASGSFNVCSAQPVQIAEIVRLIAIFNNDDPNRVLSLCSERVGDPYLLVGDNKKITSLGWRPLYKLKDIMISGVSIK